MVQWMRRSSKQLFCKFHPIFLLCKKTGAVALVQLGLTAGRQADR